MTTKKISAVELTENIFNRIDEKESEIGAYLEITRDVAKKSARLVDEKISRGENILPLEGIPCAIKDNICTKGIKTTCASKILENFVPPYNATVVTKLAAQNPVLIGKANMQKIPAFTLRKILMTLNEYRAEVRAEVRRQLRQVKQFLHSVQIQAVQFVNLQVFAAW